LDPRQDQEARVVDDELQVLLALLMGPADEAFPVGQPPRAGPEAQQRDQPISRIHAVADLAARHRRVAQVVVPRDILVPQPGGRTAPVDDAQAQRRQLVYSGHQHRLLVGGRRGDELGSAARLGDLRGRQCDQPIGLHAQHRHAATHLAQPPVGTAPIQLLAHQARQRRALERRVQLDQVGDRLQIIWAELAPAIPFHELSMVAMSVLRMAASCRSSICQGTKRAQSSGARPPA
jgi:hypothetical protein